MLCPYTLYHNSSTFRINFAIETCSGNGENRGIEAPSCFIPIFQLVAEI